MIDRVAFLFSDMIMLTLPANSNTQLFGFTGKNDTRLQMELVCAC